MKRICTAFVISLGILQLRVPVALNQTFGDQATADIKAMFLHLYSHPRLLAECFFAVSKKEITGRIRLILIFWSCIERSTYLGIAIHLLRK